jgi:hypothetical protein
MRAERQQEDRRRRAREPGTDSRRVSAPPRRFDMIRHPIAACLVILAMALTGCGGDGPTEAANPLLCIHRQLDRFEKAHVDLNFSLLNDVFDGNVSFVDLFREEAETMSRAEFIQRWRGFYSNASTVHRYTLAGRNVNIDGSQATAEAGVSWDISWQEGIRQSGGFAILFGFALQGNSCPAHAVLVG